MQTRLWAKDSQTHHEPTPIRLLTQAAVASRQRLQTAAEAKSIAET